MEQDLQNNGVSPQPWPPASEKPLFTIEKRDIVFAVCAVLLGIFASFSGVFGDFSLGYSLTCIAMTALFTVYFAKGAKIRPFPVLCGLLSLTNASVFFCTSNISVRFFSIILCFLLSLVCFDGMIRGSTKGNRQTLGIFYSAFTSIENMGICIKSLFTNSDGSRRAIGKVLLGLLCAVPVLFVVVPLLLSSDDAFRGMMDNLFADTGSTVFKTVLGIGISLFVITYGISLKADRIGKIRPGRTSGIENIYIVSFLSAISICYLLYLFSQLAYFFSAFKGFLPDGEITYAQYARKGFFEMCAIAVINLAIVFLSVLLAKKENGKLSPGIKAVTTFIALFTLIIIATAISKMVLYIDTYGMTILRLTTSAFMLFLAVVFISVILRIYTSKVNILKTALVCASCILVILGVANVNTVCAAYNYESYRSGKLDSIDVEAIYFLGDEGIPYLIKLVDSPDAAVSAEAAHCLAKAYRYDYFEDVAHIRHLTVEELKQHQIDTGFSQYSIPKARAYKCLYDYLELNPNFCDKYPAPLS